MEREASPTHAAPTDVHDAPLGDEGKYVYCVIKTPDERDFGPIGIGEGGNLVYTVRYHDLAAVVSDTPIRIYDPTRENVLAHELVNETVMREYTVIPMSFGTIFRTKNDIIELLKSTYRAFDDVLEKMRDKIEFGLKVLWDRDKVVARLEAEDDEIRRLKDEITNNAQSSTYFARMQLGRMVESALEFARIARKNDFHNFKFSMKSSNPKVMIECYRLLVARLNQEGPDWNYPIHLGVTEADRARRRREQAGQARQQRGLAAAARPEQREELACADIEVDVLERDHVAGTVLGVACAQIGWMLWH